MFLFNDIVIQRNWISRRVLDLIEIGDRARFYMEEEKRGHWHYRGNKNG